MISMAANLVETFRHPAMGRVLLLRMDDAEAKIREVQSWRLIRLRLERGAQLLEIGVRAYAWSGSESDWLLGVSVGVVPVFGPDCRLWVDFLPDNPPEAREAAVV